MDWTRGLWGGWVLLLALLALQTQHAFTEHLRVHFKEDSIPGSEMDRIVECTTETSVYRTQLGDNLTISFSNTSLHSECYVAKFDALTLTEHPIIFNFGYQIDSYGVYNIKCEVIDLAESSDFKGFCIASIQVVAIESSETNFKIFNRTISYYFIPQNLSIVYDLSYDEHTKIILGCQKPRDHHRSINQFIPNNKATKLNMNGINNAFFYSKYNHGLYVISRGVLNKSHDGIIYTFSCYTADDSNNNKNCTRAVRMSYTRKRNPRIPRIPSESIVGNVNIQCTNVKWIIISSILMVAASSMAIIALIFFCKYKKLNRKSKCAYCTKRDITVSTNIAQPSASLNINDELNVHNAYQQESMTAAVGDFPTPEQRLARPLYTDSMLLNMDDDGYMVVPDS